MIKSGDAINQIVSCLKIIFKLGGKMEVKKNNYLEWFGVLTAILYSLLVASNIGAEFLGFSLLLVSAISIGLWAYFGNHRGILLLQFFYALAGILGMFRWF